MTDLRHLIPISSDLFTLLDKIQEAGEIPCRQWPDVFYPYSQSPAKNNQDIRYAKSLCAECPVIQECRMYAISANEEYGIWGGWTAQERQQYRKTISSRKNP